MFKNKLILCLCGCVPWVVNAYQRIPVQEGIEVNAVVSTTALNRLAVENDRIASVKGTDREFELDKDGELGQVFLKPLVKEGPIHLFITTEKGHTYTLGLTTHERGAESIVLTPIGVITTLLPHSNAYESLLKELIKAMHTQQALEGFVVESAKVKLPNVKGIKVTHLQSYVGQSLLGQILEVSNVTDAPLQLTELQFYLPGVRAIAIVDKVLAPKAKTRLYWVRT
jgi:type-F conjugative transfer system secretin TraK